MQENKRVLRGQSNPILTHGDAVDNVVIANFGRGQTQPVITGMDYDEPKTFQEMNPEYSEFTQEQMAEVDSIIDEMNSRLDLIKYEDIDTMSLSEIEKVLGATFVKDIEKTFEKSEEKLPDFKRDFVRYLKGQREMSKEMDKFKKNLQESQIEFAKDMTEIFEDMENTTKMMEDLDEKIEKEEDPEKKKRLLFSKDILIESITLTSVKNKITNKTPDIIKKEVKKNFEKAYKKAYKIMNNDAKMYISPKNLLIDFNIIFGIENEFKSKCLIYIILRKITCNKNVDVKDNLGINYFILNTTKAVKNKLENKEEDEHITIFKKNVLDIYNML